MVLLVTNVFGILLLLVWQDMAPEEAQICVTHSLKVTDFEVSRLQKVQSLEQFEFGNKIVGQIDSFLKL